jgi:hypothetical protein
MLGAIGLTLEQVRILSVSEWRGEALSFSSLRSQGGGAHRRAVLFLGQLSGEVPPEARASEQSREASGVFATHSLGELVERPDLKRSAWAELQALARFLGLSVPGPGKGKK